MPQPPTPDPVSRRRPRLLADCTCAPVHRFVRRIGSAPAGLGSSLTTRSSSAASSPGRTAQADRPASWSAGGDYGRTSPSIRGSLTMTVVSFSGWTTSGGLSSRGWLRSPGLPREPPQRPEVGVDGVVVGCAACSGGADRKAGFREVLEGRRIPEALILLGAVTWRQVDCTPWTRPRTARDGPVPRSYGVMRKASTIPTEVLRLTIRMVCEPRASPARCQTVCCTWRAPVTRRSTVA